jgi:quercetin dioxygenase-like cupin family protein
MTISNTKDNPFDGLKVEKLFKSDNCETLLIQIEKGHTLPNHTTPKQALLVLQDGEAVFNIEGKQFNLKSGDYFIIPANIEHSVAANTDTILLIIR